MNIIISIIVILHKLLVYFMFFGCFLPAKYLPFHLVAWPLVYLHWIMNNNKCALTQLELKLRTGDSNNAPTVDKDHDGDYYFMKKLLADFNLELRDDQMASFTYGIFTVSWIISLIRYVNYKKSLK